MRRNAISSFRDSLVKASTIAALALFIVSLPGISAAQLGTSFTYQGLLRSGTNRASGTYDTVFGLYDSVAGGAQIGSLITNSTAIDTNGYFMVVLDFGPGVFDGGARWLEISVRTNGAGPFTALYPRQALTASPYATYAALAGAATVAGS